MKDDIAEAIDLCVDGGLGRSPEVSSRCQNLVHKGGRLHRQLPVDELSDVLLLEEVDKLIAAADRSPWQARACPHAHARQGVKGGRLVTSRST